LSRRPRLFQSCSAIEEEEEEEEKEEEEAFCWLLKVRAKF